MAPNDHLTRSEADYLIKRTVEETLLSMGIDTSDPLEMQRDFQALRDWRQAAAAVRSKGLMTIIAIVTTGVIGAIWVGVRHAIKS